MRECKKPKKMRVVGETLECHTKNPENWSDYTKQFHVGHGCALDTSPAPEAPACPTLTKCRCGAVRLLTATGLRYEENAGAICKHTVDGCNWYAPGLAGRKEGSDGK